MKHPCVEFILVCSCCEVFAEVFENMRKEYTDVESKLYVAGKNMEYIQKYGALTSTTIVINEKEQVNEISKTSIREAFEKARKS